MNDDILEEMPDLAAYSAEDAPDETPAPTYVTKADLEDFGKAMASQIAAALKPAEPVKPDAETLNWQQQLQNNAADVATTRLLEINKPILAGQVADLICEGLPKNVRLAVMGELMGLDGVSVANLTQNKRAMKQWEFLAKGMNTEMNPASIPAPRGAPSGTRGVEAGSVNDQIETMMKRFEGKVPGFNREMAKQWVKDVNE